jgi:tetratricopeptide (TPR) repeat protein
MSPHSVFHVVDLTDHGGELTVQWRISPGAHARSVDAATQAAIGRQVEALVTAEQCAGAARDITGPTPLPHSVPELGRAQRALGETLYQVLDGPDRALTQRLDEIRRAGVTLNLVVRLRTISRAALAQHAALGWHLQLVAAPEGHLALAPDVAIAVQLGEVELIAREPVTGGRLQVLFMAYAPRDVVPVLDYEAEEEQILDELAPFVEDLRLVLKVAEDGSLDELRRRLMRRTYDVVHLTGHGEVSERGPRLVMEDATGYSDRVGADQLLTTLRAGRAMPRLLVISSCRSAEHRAGLPSLAAELVQGGVPCVVGWTRPVRDDVATDAAEELYRRLCSGDLPIEAVACTRRELDRDDRARSVPTYAWATLEFLATKLSGFSIDPDETPVRDTATPSSRLYRMLSTHMRVLTEGFVGRRRELQALGRILRHGRWTPPAGTDRAIAGATVVGLKGQGKSCLVGRALDRHRQDAGELSVVVLSGVPDELQLLEAFRTEAVRLGDEVAEHMLEDASRTMLQRLERLLRHRWRERPLVIVLDDFEKNLDLPGAGEALLQPLAASLLEVLLPVCREEQPKLLITSTARFAAPSPLEGTLAEIPLGALDGSSVRKLWLRGRSAELSGIGPADWNILAQRFGRNARVLDWARQLLAGKTPDEIRKVMDAATELPVWRDQPLDEARQDDLAAAFLRHMAFDEAAAKVGPEAIRFLARARVYEEPVPIEAFSGLTTGLAVTLDQHVPALANLGLLEIGTEDGRLVYRVSPLVKPTFDSHDAPTWHAVAARFWWSVAMQPEVWSPSCALRAWRHAVAGEQQDLADEAADALWPWLDERGAHVFSATLSAQHLSSFPDSIVGLHWGGYARFRAGQVREGRPILERALRLATARADAVDDARNHSRVAALLRELARVLVAQGDVAGAHAHLNRSLAIFRKVHGTDEHVETTTAVHELAVVLRLEGDLLGAREQLEWLLRVLKKVHPTNDLPIATASHVLGRVLHAQRDLVGALACFEKSLTILRSLYGSDDHPLIAESLHERARVLLSLDKLVEARGLLERSLDMNRRIYGSDEHPSIAATLHLLGTVLLAQQHPTDARMHLQDSLAIWITVHRTDEHADVATTLHELARARFAEGDVIGARNDIDRALAIRRRTVGDEHPDMAASLYVLAGVLLAQGEFIGAHTAIEQSLQIDERVHGILGHPDIVASLMLLARVHAARGDLEAAKERLKQSQDMWHRLRSRTPPQQ